jgi:branched-chain amino acid transport system ATP-binding protein
VRFDGADVTGARRERLAELGLARTFQHGHIFGNLSVMDNVLIGPHARLRAVRPSVPLIGSPLELGPATLRPSAVREDERALRAEAGSLLALCGDRLLPRMEHLAHSLSYANRRRVEIARALALHPRLLLMDEPTAGMNESETLEMQHLIAGLKAKGQTLLLIEHKLNMVMQWSDRVVCMDDGRVITEGPSHEVYHDPAVVEACFGHRALVEAEAAE